MTTFPTLFLSLCSVCLGYRFVGGSGWGSPVIGHGYPVEEPLRWHVGLYKKSKNYFRHICGGTIIAKQAVITAAHCFTSDRYIPPPSDYAVGAGKLYRLWNHPTDNMAQKFHVVQIHIPSRYQGSLANFQDDLAIAILDRELTYNPAVEPACLNFNPVFDEHELTEGKFGKVAGWGLTGANDQSSPSLQAATLPIVHINKCIDQSPLGFKSSITSDKICAGYNNGTAVCRGDSGGGLIFTSYIKGYQENYLRGVISTSPTSGDACNLYTWATFTHILKHEHFIKSIVPDVEEACSSQIENRSPNRLFEGTSSCVCYNKHGLGSAPFIGNAYSVTTPTEFHVGVYKKSRNHFRQICGGTIIAKQVIITAAHCFTLDRYIPPASDFAVAAGKLYRLWDHPSDPRSQKFYVVQIHIPARYQGSLANFQDDLALAVLDREIQYGAVVGPACLNFDPTLDECHLIEGGLGKVVGWGLTGANDHPSASLQGATLPIVNINKCIEQSPLSFRSSITSDKICAGYNNGTAVCRGDSGGGLTFTTNIQGSPMYILRGVISTSPTSEDACNLYTWATFTHILKHERFIKSIVPDVEQSCAAKILTGQPNFRFGGTLNNCP